MIIMIKNNWGDTPLANAASLLKQVAKGNKSAAADAPL
jgi:hypothetical protein